MENVSNVKLDSGEGSSKPLQKEDSNKPTGFLTVAKVVRKIPLNVHSQYATLPIEKIIFKTT